MKDIKHQARTKLSSLFANGNISNDEFICAVCGRINKHHENYNVWYSFIPLCNECHGKCQKHGDAVEFNRGIVDGLTIHKDTGIRVSGHIVWLAVDENNQEHQVLLKWNWRTKKRAAIEYDETVAKRKVQIFLK